MNHLVLFANRRVTGALILFSNAEMCSAKKTRFKTHILVRSPLVCLFCSCNLGLLLDVSDYNML